MVLPVVVLSINSVAGFSQYMRSSAIEELAQDYIRTARAKGLPERLILTRHRAAQLAAADRSRSSACRCPTSWRAR